MRGCPSFRQGWWRWPEATIRCRRRRHRQIVMVDTALCDPVHHKPIHPPPRDVSALGENCFTDVVVELMIWEQRIRRRRLLHHFRRGRCMDVAAFHEARHRNQNSGFVSTSAGVKLRCCRSRNCDRPKDRQANLQHPAEMSTPFGMNWKS